MENSKMNVNLKRNGKEYKVLNKCVNKYLTNNNESLDLETINNIEHLLNNIEDIDVKILDAYLEIKDYTINNIDEIIELLSNIDYYKIINIHNNNELGEYVLNNVPDFEIPEYLMQFIDIEKLGEQYFSTNNIKYKFYSKGALLNIRYMFTNDLIDEKITEKHIIRLLVTDSKKYEKDNLCKRVDLIFPMSENRLKEKLELLGVKENSIKVLECSILNLYPQVKNNLTLIMEIIVSRLEFREKDISLPDVQALALRLQKMDNIQIAKFVALLEYKEMDVNSFKDIIKLTEEIKKYELLPDIQNAKAMGEYLVNETGHFDNVSELAEYIDYERLAEDYTRNGCTYSGRYTALGYLMEKESFELEQNEEEEFE